LQSSGANLADAELHRNNLAAGALMHVASCRIAARNTNRPADCGISVRVGLAPATSVEKNGGGKRVAPQRGWCFCVK
jgi:hypothetical protein